jgi:hypothetical protein
MASTSLRRHAHFRVESWLDHNRRYTPCTGCLSCHYLRSFFIFNSKTILRARDWNRVFSWTEAPISGTQGTVRSSPLPVRLKAILTATAANLEGSRG